MPKSVPAVVSFAVVLLAAMLVPGAATAQAYPGRPVRIIATFTPGSGVDFAARFVAEKLSQALGQPFVVENRAGAAGTLGSSMVASAAPDGYTLLVNSSAHTLYPSLYKELRFDPARDLVGVAPIAEIPLVLVISPDKNVRSLDDLFAMERSKPGSLTYGTSGVATTVHISAERLFAAAKVKALHVPFKGTPEAIAEVMAGRVDVGYTQVVTALPLVRANRLQPLAMAGRKRSPALPNVPTTLEAGYPDSDYTAWVGMLAPAKTPRPILERLNQEIVKALSAPEAVAKLTQAGQEPLPMGLDAFEAVIKAEFANNPALVKAAGITPQ